MSNATTLRITINDHASALLARAADGAGIGRVIARSLDTENFATVAAIKAKIGGSPVRGLRRSQVLHRRSGRLQASIGQTLSVVSGGGGKVEVLSSIGSGVGSGSAPVSYAAVHEFGGTVNIPSRRTRSMDAAYAKKNPTTKAYSFNMPERSYLRSTLFERSGRYSSRASSDLIRYIKGGGL